MDPEMPRLSAEDVSAIVGNAHGDLDKVTAPLSREPVLVTTCPALRNARDPVHAKTRGVAAADVLKFLEST